MVRYLNFIFSSLPLTFFRYCHERGRSLESEDFCDIAQNICQTISEMYQNDPSLNTSPCPTQSKLDGILADICHTKGLAAAEMNQPDKALEYLSKFNYSMEKELGDSSGGDDMRLAISWNQLGVAWMIKDEWQKGEKCFIKSIEVMKSLKDYKPYKISLPLANLGYAFWLTGRLPEAVQAFEEGLRHREAEFGPDDRESFM